MIKCLSLRKALVILSSTLICTGCACRESEVDRRNSTVQDLTSVTAGFSTDEGVLAVELEVDSPRSVSVGSDVPVRVILTNVGSTEVHFFVASDSPAILNLIQPDGLPAPLTDYGKTQLGARSEHSVWTLSLASGTSRLWNVDLRKLFVVSRKGCYRFEVSQEISYWNGVAKQDSIISARGLKFYSR